MPRSAHSYTMFGSIFTGSSGRPGPPGARNLLASTANRSTTHTRYVSALCLIQSRCVVEALSQSARVPAIRAADIQIATLFWYEQIWSIWCVATGGWSTSLVGRGETFNCAA